MPLNSQQNNFELWLAERILSHNEQQLFLKGFGWLMGSSATKIIIQWVYMKYTEIYALELFSGFNLNIECNVLSV